MSERKRGKNPKAKYVCIFGINSNLAKKTGFKSNLPLHFSFKKSHSEKNNQGHFQNFGFPASADVVDYLLLQNFQKCFFFGRWWVVCSTPHALSPYTLSPHALSPHALSPRALSPNGLKYILKNQALQR